MKVSETELPGVLLIEPDLFKDDRGFFLETFRADRYASAGIAGPFVQDNLSFSTAKVLRGLHFQNPHAQAKLVFAAEGEIFDVAVDVRADSPHFGKWMGIRLSAENGRQIYIPEGFAHGFCVVSPSARVIYKCNVAYDRAAEFSIVWNDPDIGIDWPIDSPKLSPKDAAASLLRDISREKLPRLGKSR